MFCIISCRNEDGGEHICLYIPSCIHLRKKQSPIEMLYSRQDISSRIEMDGGDRILMAQR